MLALSNEQGDAVLRELETRGTAGGYAWSRRLYAPMLWNRVEFKSLREQIESAFPEYDLTFDIVFEVKGGDEVFWHVDWESLFPFDVQDIVRAIDEKHFVSIHFNITPSGGSLLTMPDWPRLAYIYNRVILHQGLDGTAHRALNKCLEGLGVFARFAVNHSNTPLQGNSFENMKLHSVKASSSPRTSYVIRLAKRNCVRVSSRSIVQGVKSSPHCAIFRALLEQVVRDPSYDGDDGGEEKSSSVLASNIVWGKLRAE